MTSVNLIRMCFEETGSPYVLEYASPSARVILVGLTMAPTSGTVGFTR